MKFSDYKNSLVNKETLNQKAGSLNRDSYIHDLTLVLNKRINHLFSAGHYVVIAYTDNKPAINFFFRKEEREEISEEDWSGDDDEYDLY